MARATDLARVQVTGTGPHRTLVYVPRARLGQVYRAWGMIPARRVWSKYGPGPGRARLFLGKGSVPADLLGCAAAYLSSTIVEVTERQQSPTNCL